MNGPRLYVMYGAFWGLEKYIMLRSTRFCLLLVLMLSSKVWAIGLGDINLNSALNEPLRAEIVLLSASPDELADLKVSLASAETFDRYGIDRPFFLQGIEFNVVNAGTASSVVQLRSRAPIAEPFLTFLVEATWSSGRLLREYTVLLDPPTYSAPAERTAPAVEAPRRSTPSDSGQIERQTVPAPQQSRPAPPPARSSEPVVSDSGYEADPVYEAAPEPEQTIVDDSPYGVASGDGMIVQRGDTLWGIAARNRPDSRLSVNQTMLAIYEANRDAFGNNINFLKAGASLTVPSADEIFQINRRDALDEVQRQHSAWGGNYTAPVEATRPSLTLVPPDEDPVGTDYADDGTAVYEPQSREEDIVGRISELENANVPNQQSLIEIRDNELAALRQELANIRGEVYEPLTDDDAVVDEIFVDETDADATEIDDSAADDASEPLVDDAVDAGDPTVDTDTIASVPSNVVSTSTGSDKGIVDTLIEFVTGIWGIIGGAVILAVGLLFWFKSRGDDDFDDDIDRPWETLDSDQMSSAGVMSATATIEAPAPTPEEAMVVVEQETGQHPILEDTVETSAVDPGATDTSGSFGSLEDTFSSETAVNLDQSDPIAEADFHMAYGLYDQAADLINGALETDPSDNNMLSKLCEIYFVWGNRDAFVDAATRLKTSVGDGANSDWDKIVIMGQQIAADHDMFAGAELGAATKAVDLSFDEVDESAGELDMDFGMDSGGAGDDVVDLGSDIAATEDDVDFNFSEPATGEAIDFDLESTAEAATIDSPLTDETNDMPFPSDQAESDDDQFEEFDSGTSELPSLEGTLDQALQDSGQVADETAEINLDDLDLDIAGLDETEVASLDDMDATGQSEELSETGVNEALENVTDATGRNPAIDLGADLDSTGIQPGPDFEASNLVEGLDLSGLESSGLHLASDETGQHPSLSDGDDLMDLDIDSSLLDATGHTQILNEDLMKDLTDGDETVLAPSLGSAAAQSDDVETMLAPMDEEEDEFDFAKTEDLPADVFTASMDLDPTEATPAIAETDVDLDLDDLTAALEVSEIGNVGDSIEQAREDLTVEQPRPVIPEAAESGPTMSLAPEEMRNDLQEARTMTEVGTKLDLARAYVDMGDPAGARSILDEVLDEGDKGQKQQAQKLLDSLAS
jgi:pilus assembly protein FimV